MAEENVFVKLVATDNEYTLIITNTRGPYMQAKQYLKSLN